MPNKTPAPRKSTTAQGYGWDHQTHRARLMSRHVDGTRCFWCARPMYRDRTRNWDYDPHAMRKDGKPDYTSGVLAADHENTIAQYGVGRTKANRLLHGICNKQRGGDSSRDDKRPALTSTDPAILSTGLDEGLGELTYFAWPLLA
jgi:hypothetical protein